MKHTPSKGVYMIAYTDNAHATRIIGKSGAWPKIFGWKYDKPTENIWFEIRKRLDIDGIINFGNGRASHSVVRPPVFLRHFIPFALIMMLVYTTIHIPSVRLYRF
jgi:hypothetical protein